MVILVLLCNLPINIPKNESPHQCRYSQRCYRCQKFHAQELDFAERNICFLKRKNSRQMREMILVEDETGRKKALAKLLPMQKLILKAFIPL